MGKIDDMRRLREQQIADGQRRRSSPRPVDLVVPAPRREAPVDRGDTEPLQPSRPARPVRGTKTSAPKSGAPVDEQGRCAVCGKMKPVSNGLVANHQKGLGKACAGSRERPV